MSEMSASDRTSGADGTLERAGDGTVTIRFRRHLHRPVERVWKALTDPAELIGWWGDVDLELVEGGHFTIRWLNVDDQGQRVVMPARITRLEPERLLEMEGDPHGVLRFELSPAGDGTELTFTARTELPEDFASKVCAGWHYHLDALAETLDGGSPDIVNLPNERWEAIEARYAER
jgi:uncharacterized protein YndB with AHSA1/START domain